MSARAVIGAGGVVENIILAGPDFSLPGIVIVPAGDAQIGWAWDGSRLSPPTPPPVDLSALQDTLCAGIDAERDRRTDGGFVFGGVRYQSRPGDRENIAGASLAALGAINAGAQAGNLRWASTDKDFTWIAEDNSLMPMDAQTVFALGQAAMAHKQGLIFAARAVKDAVQAATDEASARAAAEWPAA